MNEISPSLFFSLQSEFKHKTYTTSEKWHEYLNKKGDKCLFLINNIDSPTVGIIGRVKKIPLLGSLLTINGELISDNASNQDITAFYKDVIKLPYFGFEINSSHRYSVDYEIGIRRAGFLRSLCNVSCPLSKLIDLTSPIEYDRNWKKNYKKAIKNNLKFDEISKPDNKDIEMFLDMFSDLSNRKNLKFKLSQDGLKALIDGKNMRLFVVKSKDNEILSSRIIYVNEKFSSAIYTANSIKGNKAGAPRFILQSILEKLSSEGIELFDVGRIPPSTTKTDGIYVFKNAVGGKLIQYNGEWVYYKSRVKEYLMLFLRRFIARPPRY